MTALPSFGHHAQLISRRELCKYLEISDRTLHDWIKKGLVPPPPINSRRTQKWFLAELLAFLKKEGRAPN